MEIFNEIKARLIGVIFMLYGVHEFKITSQDLTLVSFETYYIGCFLFVGFVLLFTGDKYINQLIELVINRFKK